MKKLDLTTDVQKQIADLYAAGKSYDHIKTTMKELHKLNLTDHAITVVRDRFKLKPRHKFPGSGNSKPSTAPVRRLRAPKNAEAEEIVKACVRKLRALERPPIAVLIEPKAGTYRIQTSVEFEGKV